MLIIAGWALTPALCVGVLAGAAIGLVNGLLSTYGRLPSLIATLGMLSIVRGRGAHLDERPAGDGEHPQRRCAGRFERLRIHGTGLRVRRRSDAARVLRRRRRSRLGRPVIHEFRLSGLRCRRQRQGCASGGHRRLSREDLGLDPDGRARGLRRHPEPRLPAERPGRTDGAGSRTRRDRRDHRRRLVALRRRGHDSRERFSAC